MAVCLVTGGAGFIGSHLVEALLDRGHVVRVLDNFSTGTLGNLARVMDAIELFPGDVADLDLVSRAASGVELVFHQAPPVRPPAAAAGPLAAQYQDAVGAIHVLTAALAAQVRRVIYASSVRVYGHPPAQPCHEDQPKLPLDRYAVAKLAEEEACLAFTRIYGLETVRLRYTCVFGPRLPPASPYAAVVAHSLGLEPQEGKTPLPPNRKGVGTCDAKGPGPFAESQDLIFVDDVIHSNLLAAEVHRVSGKVYNIGRGRPTADREVVETVNAILGTEVRSAFGSPVLPKDVRNVACVSRAETDLGFCASTDLEQGLRRCIDFCKPQPVRGPHIRLHAPKNGS
jgi:UDP-glucose 4-epimerase